MSQLLQSQVDQIVNNPTRHPEVDLAVREELRAKLHTEPSVTFTDTNPAMTLFLDWVRTLIDSSKYAIFQHLLTSPVPTVDVSESIFNEVKKIFEGQDRFVGYQFTNEKLRTDFEIYLKSINDDSFWRTNGLQAIKNGYNSLVVVDLPKLETDEPANDIDNVDLKGVKLLQYPEPYYYILPIDHVLNIEIDRMEREIEWVFFTDCTSNQIAYLIDEVCYRTFRKDDRGKWILVSLANHNLGYVPVKNFWSTPLSSKSVIRRRGLISNSLGNFDRLLFKIISELHVELYAEYPIMTMYSQKCDYTDPEGNTCTQGKVKSLMKADGIRGQQLTETFVTCPKCNGGISSLGAGSVFEAPAMAKADDPNLIDAVKFVTVDVNSLKWIADKVQTLSNQLTYSIIGVVDEVSANVAINKDQVASQYESRQNVLMDVKNQMEDIHKWTHETIATLRYGKGFVSATVNYGSKFFIATSGQLSDSYIKARDGGMPSFELANQRLQIYETKYRSNPEMLQRVRILSNIEPYQDYSLTQIKDLAAIVKLDPRLLNLKLNFDSYVLRFEREYVDVNSFMQYSDFSTKISLISEILLGYADEALINSNVQQTINQ